MKHKHCDVIKAWADGAVVQSLACDGTWVTRNYPKWDESVKYRASLAIVEGKPVFEGDVLYAPYTGKITVTGTKKFTDCTEPHLSFQTPIREEYVPPRLCSWSPPQPKTITVTIPRPVKIKEYCVDSCQIIFASEVDAVIAQAKIEEAMK